MGDKQNASKCTRFVSPPTEVGYAVPLEVGGRVPCFHVSPRMLNLMVLDQTEIENTCGIQSEGSNFWCGQWIVVVSLLGMSVCI